MFEQTRFNGLFAFRSSSASCNIYLLKGSQNVLIDTGLESDSSALEHALAQVSLSPKDISIVLHTHGHADHIGGNILFPDAQKWMGQHDGALVNKKDDKFTVAYMFNQKFYPTINNFYSKNKIFLFPPFTFQVIETPGHTKGSICLHDRKNKILISGDTLFNGAVGRYDLVSSSKQDLLSSIKKISSLDYELLLSGHGAILAGKQKENILIAMQLLK